MRSGRWPLLAAAMVVALLVAPAPVAAQDPAVPPDAPGASASDPTFPAPTVAPVMAADRPPELAIAALYAETAAEDVVRLVVRFESAFDPPEGYELDVHLGDPLGEQLMASLLVTSEGPSGSIGSIAGGELVPVGPAVATVEGPLMAIEVPAGLVPDDGVVWAAARVPEPFASFVTGTFPLPLLLADTASGGVFPSEVAWVPSPDGGVPGVATLPPGPELSLVDGILTLTYRALPPTEIEGVAVEGAVDVVRIAPDFLRGGAAPYLVAIDHEQRAVNLLDGTQPIPVGVESPEASWFVEGLEPGDVPVADTVLAFSLEGLAEAFGIALSNDATAVGVARSFRLTDGTTVRADGVQATLRWLETAAAAAALGAEEEAAEALPPPLVPPEPTPAEGGFELPAWAIALVVVLAGLVAWRVLSRWRVNRRHPVDPEGPREPLPVREPAAALRDRSRGEPGGAAREVDQPPIASTASRSEPRSLVGGPVRDERGREQPSTPSATLDALLGSRPEEDERDVPVLELFDDIPPKADPKAGPGELGPLFDSPPGEEPGREAAPESTDELNRALFGRD